MSLRGDATRTTPLDSNFRWNDEDDKPVIPGEQRETRNPGAENWIPACAGNDGQGGSLCFCPWTECAVLWTTRNDSLSPGLWLRYLRQHRPLGTDFSVGQASERGNVASHLSEHLSD